MFEIRPPDIFPSLTHHLLDSGLYIFRLGLSLLGGPSIIQTASSIHLICPSPVYPESGRPLRVPISRTHLLGRVFL